jgi:hypothetical protein
VDEVAVTIVEDEYVGVASIGRWNERNAVVSVDLRGSWFAVGVYKNGFEGASSNMLVADRR